MPKIAYVCENCWENNSEASCHEDRKELRVCPDGQWMCDSCYEYDPDHESDENRTPWHELPAPPEYKPAALSAVSDIMGALVT
jgi:hypothetical protein